MITGMDSADLGAKLFILAGGQQGVRLRFRIDPSRMTALQMPCVAAVIPILTGHGDGRELARIIHSYHQWGEPIYIGLIQAVGIFQFWVENNDIA